MTEQTNLYIDGHVEQKGVPCLCSATSAIETIYDDSKTTDSTAIEQQ